MSLKLTTAPTTEPITLADAKLHCRVDGTDEDTLITELIIAARQYVEGLTRRPLITQSWTYYADDFDYDIELKANLQSVTSINYIDTDGNSQLLDTANYSVDTFADVGVVYPAYGLSWPYARCVNNSVAIEFVAGYGAAADVPSPITQAMLLLIGHFYQNRESVMVAVSVAETPMAVDMLLNPYRVVSF
jgi:uncharacterized phiE125 gp8 family phage protein